MKFSYALTERGRYRCINNEFYLQKTPEYKGYTEAIFRLLYKSKKALTTREISNLTGIRTRNINGVLTYNIPAGYIRKIKKTYI